MSVIRLSWFLPRGYSHHAVRGFQLSLNTARQHLQCYHFDMSNITWSLVPDVETLEFSHCVEFNVYLTDTVFVSLYSLPKAASNAERGTLKLSLTALPEASKWNVNISLKAVKGSLDVTFRPWFPGAKSIRLCLFSERLDKCVKEIRLSHNESYARFTSVNCSEVYSVALRPVSSEAKVLDRWVLSQRNITMPCHAPEAESPLVKPLSHKLLIVILCALIICLVTAFIAFCWIRRKAEKKCLLCEEQLSVTETTNNESKQQVLVLYYPESVIYQQAIMAHLDILHRYYGLKFNVYDDRSSEEETIKWIDENLKHCIVLVYYSKTVDNIHRGVFVFQEGNKLALYCQHTFQKLHEVSTVPVVYLTLDAPGTYNVSWLIHIVKVEQGNVSIVNFERILHHLENPKSSVPSRDETRELNDFVCQLYDLECEEDAGERDNMIPQYSDCNHLSRHQDLPQSSGYISQSAPHKCEDEDGRCSEPDSTFTLDVENCGQPSNIRFYPPRKPDFYEDYSIQKQLLQLNICSEVK